MVLDRQDLGLDDGKRKRGRSFMQYKRSLWNYSPGSIVIIPRSKGSD
jgi:hypothetical protein